MSSTHSWVETCTPFFGSKANESRNGEDKCSCDHSVVVDSYDGKADDSRRCGRHDPALVA